jgi:hypothetical protein
MTRIIKWLLLSLALLLSPLLGKELNAQTITAASCNASDVQTALNSVSADGSTVSIPAGTCHWSTIVTFSKAYSTTIQGQTIISGTCAPPSGACTATDNTIIYDDVNHGGSDPATLQLNTAAGKSLRLTGISMLCDTANTSGPPYNGMIAVFGSSKLVRIDHNDITFCITGGKGINLDGWLYGVVDHNLFNSSVSVTNDIEFQEPGWNGGSDPNGLGNASWTDIDYFGTGNFMFAENNLFTGGGWAYDCTAGGRYVFRYNLVGPHVKLQTHGLTSDAHRSCRNMEVYNNSLVFSSTPVSDNFAFLIELEGGTGLFWGNTVTGFVQFIHEDTVRTNNLTYSQTAPPNGWGYCGTGVTGVTSAWDQNTNSAGYACIDQVGRGKGDLLTGSSFPNIVDSVTNKVTSPNQALDPVYAWANTYNPVPQEGPDAYWSSADSAIVENRDYYLELPNYNEPSATFTGTVGIGQGLLSTRPSTCTPMVAYWATDQNTLYQCQAGNTWTTYYTPFTYPHPLVSGSQTSGDPSGAPPAPTNLTVVVN